jgi:hypothetical protein
MLSFLQKVIRKIFVKQQEVKDKTYDLHQIVFLFFYIANICTYKYYTELTRNSCFVDHGLTEVSKWAGTRYFYPPEIVYSTGRNY